MRKVVIPLVDPTDIRKRVVSVLTFTEQDGRRLAFTQDTSDRALRARLTVLFNTPVRVSGVDSAKVRRGSIGRERVSVTISPLKNLDTLLASFGAVMSLLKVSTPKNIGSYFPEKDEK